MNGPAKNKIKDLPSVTPSLFFSVAVRIFLANSAAAMQSAEKIFQF